MLHMAGSGFVQLWPSAWY